MTGDHPLYDALERDRLVQAAHAIADDISDWFRRDTHGTQAPAATPVTVMTSPHEGDTMSLATDLRDLADKLEPFADETLAKVQAVSANPATRDVFDVLHQLTGLGLDPAVIAEVAGGLKTLVRIYTPQQAAPAGPQVAGQA